MSNPSIIYLLGTLSLLLQTCYSQKNLLSLTLDTWKKKKKKKSWIAEISWLEKLRFFSWVLLSFLCSSGSCLTRTVWSTNITGWGCQRCREGLWVGRELPQSPCGPCSTPGKSPALKGGFSRGKNLEFSHPVAPGRGRWGEQPQAPRLCCQPGQCWSTKTNIFQVQCRQRFLCQIPACPSRALPSTPPRPPKVPPAPRFLCQQREKQILRIYQHHQSFSHRWPLSFLMVSEDSGLDLKF